MSRRFTKSKDGTERCTVTIKLRLTRDEIENLENYAECQDFDDVEHVCQSEAGLAVEGLLSEVAKRMVTG